MVDNLFEFFDEYTMNLTTVDFGILPNGLKAKLFQIICDDGMRERLQTMAALSPLLKHPTAMESSIILPPVLWRWKIICCLIPTLVL